MATETTPRPDDFPGGFLITDMNNDIVYASRYMNTRFGFDHEALPGRNLYELLTKASRIICESYIMPLLLHEEACEEIHLYLSNAVGDRMPVIINAALNQEAESRIHWSLYSSLQRDELDQQLLEARRLLEEKTEELQRLSITDELTGLLNRRELLRRSEVILAAGKRDHHPVSMLVLDIDFFKQINDTHGHATGDDILRQFGHLLQKQGRESDIIARVGGEEFVFLLPDTDCESARTFAKRLHRMIGDLCVNDCTITVSIGIGAVAGTHSTTFNELFRLADKAVYEAKTAGRNRTCVEHRS